MQNYFSRYSLAVIGVSIILLGAGCAPREQREVAAPDTTEGAGAMMKREAKPAMAQPENDNNENVTGAMMKDKPAPVNEGVMMKATGTMMVNPSTGVMGAESVPAVKMMAKGSYEAYAPEKIALAKTSKVVLFFHAPWCPTCRAADAALASTEIPSGLTVLKVDYDTAAELKKKYGVTSQHTFVEVDAKGMLLKKWLGTTTVAELEAQLN